MSLAECVNHKPTIETDRLRIRPMTSATFRRSNIRQGKMVNMRRDCYAYGI